MPKFGGLIGRAISPGRKADKSPGRKRAAKLSRSKSPPLPGPPPPPPVASPKPETSELKWEECNDIHYMVKSPWEWVMNEVVNEVDKSESMTQVDAVSDLPSSHFTSPTTNGTADNNVGVDTSARRRSRRSAARKRAMPATLRIELGVPLVEEAASNDKQSERQPSNSDAIILHGTSSCFDGLEDKDEMCRTLQRCRCDHLNLSPPTVLIGWDVNKEVCLNLVGDEMPVLPSNTSPVKFAVLKEPMGSKGTGIFFVKNANEIYDIISEHKKRATEEPEFLDKMIEVKGRIPSWVLQAEVNPCYLLEGKYKFHVRSYVVAVEKVQDQQLLDTYIYKHHEVRVAKLPIDKNNDEEETRNRDAHITNGALSSDTVSRSLLHQIPELVKKNFQAKIEIFLAKTFQHLMKDMQRRVAMDFKETSMMGIQNPNTQKFAIGGVDMMIAADGTIYLLEVNVNPSAPSEESVNDEFKSHLVGFMKNLLDLVVSGKYTEDTFISTSDLLQKTQK